MLFKIFFLLLPFNGTKNTFFPHPNGLLCSHHTLETTTLECQQCFQSGCIIWLDKLVINQFCDCQHFFMAAENANLMELCRYVSKHLTDELDYYEIVSEYSVIIYPTSGVKT